MQDLCAPLLHCQHSHNCVHNGQYKVSDINISINTPPLVKTVYVTNMDDGNYHCFDVIVYDDNRDNDDVVT